jgi:hypothetical protein
MVHVDLAGVANGLARVGVVLQARHDPAGSSVEVGPLQALDHKHLLSHILAIAVPVQPVRPALAVAGAVAQVSDLCPVRPPAAIASPLGPAEADQP